MSAADEEIAAAEERLYALLLAAREDADAVLRKAANEADRLIRDVKAKTGVEIGPPPPPAKPPTVMDVSLGSLAEVAELCGHLLAAVELLAPHVQFGSERTVGALLKTTVDVSTGSMARHYLQKSGFFTNEEGA